MNIWVLAIIIMGIAFLMTMTGRGGGNFYVLALVFSGYSMSLSASSAQFVLMCSSLVAAVLFSKNKMSNFKLTLLLGILIFISALVGGYFGKFFDEKILKITFSILMFIAAIFMLKKPKARSVNNRSYILKISSKEGDFYINLLVTIPFVLLTGFLSGMVGISGGSFLVPLMLLSMQIPMHLAVGTSTILVSLSASAGFLGHLSAGIFDYRIALPLAVGGMIGGFLGAKIALKSKPKNLKFLFAGTQIVAAIIMMIEVIKS